MSCVPPVSGRVNAIKSQFESLSSLESLDINGCKTAKKPSVRFQFQRAATSFDLIKRSEKAKNAVKNWSSSSSSSTARSCDNELLPPKQRSDSALLASQRHSTKQPDDPNRLLLKRGTTETKSDVKLARHTSDPVKRSSIKRSPAFRVGEKQNKTILIKQSPITPTEIADNKFGKFLAKNCGKNMERLQQPGLTDSLKAALRQPLPAGPPPKKPPRTFGGSPTSDDRDPITLFAEADTENEPHDFRTKPTELQDKINFLESNLAMKKDSTNHAPIKTRTPLQKSKTELVLQGSKFLNCISCHRETTPVYDSVDVEDELKPLLLQKSHTTCLGKKLPEHIYMEPFGHLKPNSRLNSNCSSIAEETSRHNTGTSDSETSKENICTCPENHKAADSHYLCTAINESSVDVDCSEKEANISLGKTYDEITILLNAAFQQKTSDTDSCSMSSKSNEDNENRNSIKLSRSLTEKRKDYVRRVSVVPSRPINSNYGTLHRTFKSPVIKTFSFDEDEKNNNSDSNEPTDLANRNGENFIKTSDRINKYKELIEASNNSCTTTQTVKHRAKRATKPQDDEHEEMCSVTSSENDNTQKVFQVCMLVGYNTSTNSAYIKSKYPPNEPVPDNIEQLVFPSSNLIKSGRKNQEYCLILTDDNGFKVYGYCRRVLPEKSEMCLPLAYCIISVTKALGFYQKVLKEIESRHGQSDTQLSAMLRNIQNSRIPNAGKYLHVKLPLTIRPKTLFSSNHKISPKRLSLEANPKWLTESATQAAFADQDNNETGKSGKRQSGLKSLMQEFEDSKKQQAPFDFGLINRSLIVRDPKFDEILIRRPNDLRLENTELSDLLECLGPDLLINIFSSLLHERKVILQGGNISLISKSILALQTILYPFQWQYTIVTILPQSLIEICQAPFPVLAGVLDNITFEIEDGILVDMNLKQITQICGDEQTIIPDSLRKSLNLSLEMVDLIDQGKMLSSVLISEAFLRFFVELFGDYCHKEFHKDEFIQAHRSQNIKFFLEWFLETSMFRHYCNSRYLNGIDNHVMGSECDGFYKLFDARLMEKSENKTKTSQNIETIVKNSKIINKKGKTFKDRFKQFLS